MLSNIENPRAGECWKVDREGDPWVCEIGGKQEANADPVMGTDRGSKFAPTRKRADVREVLDYERTRRTF